MAHYLIRIGDSANFIASSPYRIWGINSKNSDCKHFIKNVRPGDILWFIKGQSQGLVVGCATFVRCEMRIIGPIITIHSTNEELGWTAGDWDTEVHYTDLYNLSTIDDKLYTGIKSPKMIRRYNDKCNVNLIMEYPYIVRYRSTVAHM